MIDRFLRVLYAIFVRNEEVRRFGLFAARVILLPAGLLYKYGEPLFAPLILEERSIKLTLPAEANDPFEFFPRAEDLSHESEALLQSLAAAGAEIPEPILAYFKRFSLPEHTIARTWQLMKEVVTHAKENGLPIQLAAVRLMPAVSSSFTGVLCLSAKPDDIVMWSHYAANHTGIVIGLDPMILRTIPGVWEIGPVRYRMARPRVPRSVLDQPAMLRLMRGTFLTKSNGWAYEKEWRLLVNRKSEAVAKNNTVVTLRLPAGAIKRVILGCRCSAETVKRVTQAVTSDDLRHVSVLRAGVDPRDYKLRLEASTNVPAPRDGSTG